MKIKGFLSLCSFFFLSLTVLSGSNRIAFSGGLNHVFQYGSESEYVPGENDFPVTPAHNNLTMAISYTRIFSHRYGFQLDLRRHSGTGLNLKDPSDDDEIQIDGAGHLTVTLNFVYFLSKSSIKPYLIAGAGMDFLTCTKEQTVTSKFGYTVTISPPEKNADLCFNLGTGMDFSLGKRIGLNLELRYLIIAGEDRINNVNFGAGIFLNF